jgi:hypothetical protein
MSCIVYRVCRFSESLSCFEKLAKLIVRWRDQSLHSCSLAMDRKLHGCQMGGLGPALPTIRGIAGDPGVDFTLSLDPGLFTMRGRQN